MEGLKIQGLGYAIAQKTITNEDLSHCVDTSDEWIVQRTGIRTRHITENENTSDLAYRAALKAIEDAHIDKKEIDVILCATATPDCVTPSCASLIQGKLGLSQSVFTFDLNAACSGFIYGLEVALHLLESYRCVLLIGAETLSKIIDWTDRNTCVLFGDGAGAAILKKSKKKVSFYANSQPDLKGTLQARGRLIRKPLSSDKQEVGFLSMNGKEVYRFALKEMQNAMEAVKREDSWDDVDLIIPHQANLRIIQQVARNIKQPLSKFYINLDRFGNTSAASIAIALACAKEEKRLKEGMHVLLVGFGGGLCSGAIYMEW